MVNDVPGGGPPSQVYARPAAFTVRTSDAMLKSVRCGLERTCVRKVHCAQALTAATSIVSSAPRSSSAAKSTAYDTDIVEPLVARGRLTLRAEASDEQRSSVAKTSGFAMVCGVKNARTSTPATRTAPT